MRVNVSGPIGTPPTRIVVRRAWFCADTSLYGAVMRIVSATPGRPSASRVSEHLLGADDADDRAHHAAADEGLPAVRLDVARRRRRCPSSDASGAITMTMAREPSARAEARHAERMHIRWLGQRCIAGRTRLELERSAELRGD